MSTDLLIVNGPGVVARRGPAVLWAESTDLRREGLLASMVTRLDLIADGEGSPEEFAAWIITELAGPQGATVPALALAIQGEGVVVTLVHGWGRVTGPGGTVTAPGTPHRIPAKLPIAIGRADLAVLARGDSLLDLEAGVVPGGAALLLERVGAAPERAARERPAPAPAPEPAVEPAPAREPAPAPEPVLGAAPAPHPVPAPEPTPAPAPTFEPVRARTPSFRSVVEPTPAPRFGPPRTTPPPGAPSAPPPDRPRMPAPAGVVSLRPDPETPRNAERGPLPIAAPAPARGAGGAPSADEPHPAPSGPRAAIVPGVRCARQHFNHPAALYCRVCGVSMLQQTHVQVHGERPPLGVLVCDDGSTYGLDGDYAIGSDPRAEPGVVSGLAQPLVLGDAAAGVAPTHIIIHLNGWDVMALNRSPGLPAAVLHRGDAQWTPLPPGQWAALAPGSYVGFAGRHVVFESNHRA